MNKIIKTKETCGADQNTPSYAEYFTWLNNTNEGSTEAQTLANLAFFAYLKKEYGMQIDIYAWDAGNMDGAKKTYADFSKGKLKRQYPNGYLPIVQYADSLGIRLGVWGGTDGYGNTKKSALARQELLVHLCRDYHFALFKFDRVCGKLRPIKRGIFAETMQKCRIYSPDLVLLLHRNKVGKAVKYATTDLWQRKETYVDANSYNLITAPHHRAFAFTRGLTPDLNRLLEDHGVCICSHNDYFEDDLIMQAFGRCLILAPEIYGNPFFLRDDEYPILARIFNLHRQYRDILVNGIILPSCYGTNAVSRGNDERRFIVSSNPSWETNNIIVTLDDSIGLKAYDKIVLQQHFPTEKYLGTFSWGEKVSIPNLPFRALLIEAVHQDKLTFAIENCEYSILHEVSGIPDKIRITKSNGKPLRIVGKDITLPPTEEFDNTEIPPVFLGSMKKISVPTFARTLYESAMFSASNDSMEWQSICRAGISRIPEVTKAREFFFTQENYVNHGCESNAMFDGNQNTFFGKKTKPGVHTLQLKSGVLRVDLGQIVNADTIEIEYFEADKNVNKQTPKQRFCKKAEISKDLQEWSTLPSCSVLVSNNDFSSKLVIHHMDNIETIKGKLKKAIFTIGKEIRYFALPKPMCRIHSFTVLANNKIIPLPNPKANNLMAPYNKVRTKHCYMASVTIPSDSKDSFIAVAVNGYHGKEGVYCSAKCGEKMIAPFDRAPCYPVNNWQHEVVSTSSNNTYYFDITSDMLGKTLDFYALFNYLKIKISSIDIYICHKHNQPNGIELSLEE